MENHKNQLDATVDTITLRNVPDGLKAKLIVQAEEYGMRLLGRKMPLGAFVIKILRDFTSTSG